MRIKPDHKNVDREENYSPKGYITGKKDPGEIKYKVDRKLCPLTYKTIKHCFLRPVNKVLFAIVKVIDNIARCHNRGCGQDHKEQVRIKHYLPQRQIRRQDVHRSKVHRNNQHQDIVTPNDGYKTENF